MRCQSSVVLFANKTTQIAKILREQHKQLVVVILQQWIKFIDV